MDTAEIELRNAGPDSQPSPVPQNFRLPVSGIEVALSVLTGHHDVLLRETAALDIALAVRLLARASVGQQHAPMDWLDCIVTDIDAALVELRRRALGDQVAADLVCPAPTCGQRVSIEFSLTRFMAHHAPRPLRHPCTALATEQGWYGWEGESLRFRPPTARDVLAASACPNPEREYLLRCMRPAAAPASARRRVIHAIEAMAPSLADEVQGQCTGCGAVIKAFFDARTYVLRELRGLAETVYADACLLARHCHWREADILAMPSERRLHYVDCVTLRAGRA